MNRYMIECIRRAGATTQVSDLSLVIDADSEDEAEAIADGILNAAVGIAQLDIDSTCELA